MQEKKPASKPPPKKYQPKGLAVLYEDQDIVVVNKANGLLTISTDREKEKTAHFLLNDYVKRGNIRSRNRVFIVHRLDRDTSGVKEMTFEAPPPLYFNTLFKHNK